MPCLITGGYLQVSLRISGFTASEKYESQLQMYGKLTSMFQTPNPTRSSLSILSWEIPATQWENLGKSPNYALLQIPLAQDSAVASDISSGRYGKSIYSVKGMA